MPCLGSRAGVRGGHGLQRAGQLAVPSLRMQTNGHRHVVMLPVEKLSLYIQSCQKGQRPSYKDLLSFVSSVARMFPNEIQHGILSKHTLADVPPGWLLMEKVFFAELKRLLPFGLPQMCRNFLVSWSHAGLEREMLFRTPVDFLPKEPCKNTRVAMEWMTDATSKPRQPGPRQP